MRRPAPSLPVAALRNLGPKSARLLAEAGITRLDELQHLGAVKAYVRAKALRPHEVSLNLLWALAAGLDDRDWRSLTPDEKALLIGSVRLLGQP